MTDNNITTSESRPTRLHGWSVRQKIGLGFAGLILLMAVGMGITLLKLEDIHRVTRSVIELRQPTANIFQKMNQELNLATSLLNGYLLTGEIELRDEYHAVKTDIKERLKTAVALADEESLDLDVQQLNQASALFDRFAELAEKLYELKDNNANNRGLILATDTLNDPAIGFIGNINTLLAAIENRLNDPQMRKAYNILQELRYSWIQMMNSLRLYTVTQADYLRKNMDTFNARADEMLNKLTAMDLDIGFGELDEMVEQHARYMTNLQPVLGIFASGNWRADAYLIKTKLRPVLNDLRRIFESTADAQLRAAIKSGQLLSAAQQQILYTTLIILAIGLLLGTLLAMRITHGIVPPIQHLMKAAQQVANGDLNAEVMVTSQDEIGQLGNSFNTMTNHLRAATMKEQNMLNELQALNQGLEQRVVERTKELESNEIRIRAILNNIGEGIIVLNEQGAIESMNPAAETIFKTRETDAIGLNATLLIAGIDDADISHPENYNDLRDGIFKSSENQQPCEHLGLRSDGTTFPLEFVVSAMKVDGKHLRVCILRDVSARKETEASLAEAQNQLVDAAHKSGMADMATGVLHNIGNILNSVNLSGEEIQRISKNSKIAGLLKANDLLIQHKGKLGEFLTQDTRGQKLPDYLIKMGKVLNDEIDTIKQESAALIKKTTMMKEVISTQQAYAKSSFHSEQLSLPELVEDALKLEEASLKKWGIKLNTQIAEMPPCTGQKSKLLQVITNLIKNAKEAMNDNDQYNRPKELSIEAGLLNAKTVYLKVQDNGCGISKDQLKKIFNHGFTTKETGHGFGLHTSANAMTEMKGSLKVESDGLQKGACFTVTLPVSQAA